MKALFPDRPITSTKELKELWRRMKNKAKAAAREKKVDIQKTGGGEAVTGDQGGEILAVLNIIAGELEQIHYTVDDDAVASQGDDARDHGQDMAQVATTSAAELDSGSIDDDINFESVSEDIREQGEELMLQHPKCNTKGTGNGKSSAKTAVAPQNSVMQKTDQALSYLKEEHETHHSPTGSCCMETHSLRV